MPRSRAIQIDNRILGFITEYTREHGLPPTYQEIAADVGFNSTNTVHYHLSRLERAGIISRKARSPRSLRLRSADSHPASAAPANLAGSMRGNTAAIHAHMIEFIRWYMAEFGYSPSVREIAASSNTCINYVFRHLRILEAQGKIRHMKANRSKAQKRSIVVTDAA